MDDEELVALREELKRLEQRIDTLDREVRFLIDPDEGPEDKNLVEFQGDFFQMISTLRALYLDQEDDKAKILKISRDIEKGRVRVDMAELFFRFFLRQEIQNSRMKLLFLAQKYDLNAALFDQLDDLAVLVDDHHYSVQQVIVGWKRFEREAGKEIKRLLKNGSEE
jgi:hypothetical protein